MSHAARDLRRSDISARGRAWFWARVDKSAGIDACWPWRGFVHACGYGRVRHNGVARYAHRVAFVLVKGNLLNEKHVLHRCDFGLCCNPAHLFKGTIRDNMADRDAKGRGRVPYKIGKENGKSILTHSEVSKIKIALRRGASHSDIGIRFGVHRNTISAINSGRTWRHVPWPRKDGRRSRRRPSMGRKRRAGTSVTRTANRG